MSDNPYAASSTRLADEVAEHGEIVLASRFKRLIARLIDQIIYALLTFLCLYVYGSWFPGDGSAIDLATSNTISSPSDAWKSLLFTYDLSFNSLFLFLLSIAIAFVVQGYFLAQFGQTIGKMALNIKITDKENLEKPSLTRLFVVRECGMSIIGILPILSLINVLWIFGPARRCLHDHWSRTIVVNA